MPNSSLPLAGLLLAAGEARRFGMPKQLLVSKGQPLLRQIIQQWTNGIDHPLVVVLGARTPMIKPVLEDLPIQIVENQDWSSGMAGTLRTGLQFLLDQYPDLQSVLIMVGDQPYLKAPLLQEMQTIQQTTNAAIVACEYQNGGKGVPVIFDRSFFPELLALEGQDGARKLLLQNEAQVHWVPFPQGHLDIDQPKDWENYLDQQ